MAPRVGVHKADVIEAAARLVDAEKSADAVRMRDIAEQLGVRTQSLYAHVDGVAGLHRDLALHGMRELRDALRDAAVGRSGGDAVRSVFAAWLGFAVERHGLFQLMLRPATEDEELGAAMDESMAPLRTVLGSFGLDDDEIAHWHRLMFAAVYGFARLAALDLFRLPADSAATVEHMIDVFVDELERERR